MRVPRALVATAALLYLFSTPLSAATNTVHVGALTCNTGPSVGLLIGSQQQMNCLFTSRRGLRENYTGTINRLGLDIGLTAGGRMVWCVYAPSSGLKSHALAGNYVGAGANASLVVGAGANALVGGSNRTIALQPLSVERRVGANLAMGVANLTLQ
jgi:hypothetical protein